mmetsp:Transcript_9186/g.30279  ORF Transcript_9186/g.30279 Transcript_9186/m.30279 type:complete len:255 (+) Transcript_9186:53-817(+)
MVLRGGGDGCGVCVIGRRRNVVAFLEELLLHRLRLLGGRDGSLFGRLGLPLELSRRLGGHGLRAPTLPRDGPHAALHLLRNLDELRERGGVDLFAEVDKLREPLPRHLEDVALHHPQRSRVLRGQGEVLREEKESAERGVLGRGRGGFSAGAEEGGVAEEGFGAQDAVRARRGHERLRLVEVADVAICEHRNGYRLLDRFDGGPVRAVVLGVLLVARAPVHRENLAARLLEHARVRQCAVELGKDANLARDGHL